MKKVIAMVPMLALLILGCSFYETIIGSGHLVEVEMAYKDFSVLDIDAPVDVTVIYGTEHSVTVMADDNVLDHVQVTQVDRTLTMDLDSRYNYSNVTLKSVITLPLLEGLQLAGASMVTVIDSASLPSVSSFSAQVSEASRLLLGSISAQSISIDVQDAGSATISAYASTASVTVDNASSLQMDGSANDLVLVVADASSANLRDFAVTNASTKLSGASKAWVNIDGTLRPDITGASSLYYHGSAFFVSPVITGASSIIQY